MMDAEERLLNYLTPLVKAGRELLEEGYSEAEGLAEGQITLCTVTRRGLAELYDALKFPPDIEATIERRLREL